jgi:NADH-quinone oxidoreductase subunit F
MPYRLHLMVCAGTGCVSNRSLETRDALVAEIAKRGLADEIEVVPTGCNGFCGVGPIVVVQPEGIFYRRVRPNKVPQLVEEHLLKGRPVKGLMYTPPKGRQPIPKMSDIPFFGKQMLIALRNRGLIDPEKIEDAIARGAYEGMAKALTTMSPGEVIEEIKASGLRGRGGGGFPTGIKWETCVKKARETDGICYLICNCDEGDPGAFMDRSIVESDPHSVIEGMVIGAYAIGTHQGYIYVRHEYPLACKRFELALGQARELGLLGADILGTGFDFDIEVHHGAGAFVCGESTALMASIEGRVGEPRAKYIHTVESGLYGRPTVLNNVETWANVPMIIERGFPWFASIGTEHSKGTKVFSLTGRVNNTGLVEVPMGITLREMIFDIGGGIPGGRRFKAVQTGGPSGGCIPATSLDLPVDFDKLYEVGSMMGSGGMIVMDESTCMVDLARYFIDFLQGESCGKCVPCREGLRHMGRILTNICAGRGKEGDVELLEELSQTMTDASLCALGGTAANPVLSTIRYFRDEYEAHITYKRCPAGVCGKLVFTTCKYACPLRTDISTFVARAARHEWQGAFEAIRVNNPFPLVTSYICHHPCEDKCRAGEFGEAVAIKAVKRHIADRQRRAGSTARPRPLQRHSERVAVVGGGPAGLTAAWQLRRMGYGVTVFEAEATLGGMIAAAIPRYRLPLDILNEEIEAILRWGIKVQTKCVLGRDVTLIDLLRGDYQAVFLATGAHESRTLGIPGENLEGVVDGLAFLKATNAGKKMELGKRVAVIGGGNAAIDTARTAWRWGSDVSILYRRTAKELPAMKTEVAAARDEGLTFQYLVSPVRIVGDQGKVRAVECVRMELGEPDETGRPRPVPIAGSEFKIEVDNVVVAVGERASVQFLRGPGAVNVTGAGLIKVDPETLATDMPGVFAGGDAVTGPSTIADSMAQGMLAAGTIHRYLRHESLKPEYKPIEPSPQVEPLALSDKEVEALIDAKRAAMPMSPLDNRRGGFEKVELGLTEDLAVQESRRCMRCDLKSEDE